MNRHSARLPVAPTPNRTDSIRVPHCRSGIIRPMSYASENRLRSNAQELQYDEVDETVAEDIQKTGRVDERSLPGEEIRHDGAQAAATIPVNPA